tara:strand:+ start:3109 stop:3942 length:834 start_codon:yes stop_codon:yes gene_type:complete
MKFKKLIKSSFIFFSLGSIFIIPFYFILVNASKHESEINLSNLYFPSKIYLWENLKEVFAARNYQLVLAFFNSTMITVFSVIFLVILSALVGYVLQRRKSKFTNVIMFIVLLGLMIPPAVVPTIMLMQKIGLFGTIQGIVFIQIAYNSSFSILLYRQFMTSIPRELDEAAYVDGAKPLQVFFKIIFPLLFPITITNIILQVITVFNDFVNPLYFLPGKDGITVQLTLYNYATQGLGTSQNFALLYSNILLVTIPPLILFIFLNKRIIDGMTAGAVKG